MAVTQKNKHTIPSSRRTFRNIKRKNRTQRKRKTLKPNKRKTSGGTSSSTKTEKVYKTNRDLKTDKYNILTRKLPDKPFKSAYRAFVKFDNAQLDKMSKADLETIYRQWRDKEATGRRASRTTGIKAIRTTESQNKKPWPPNVHYNDNNVQFDPYNPNNEFGQSFSETANWLDEMPPAMQPSRSITPSSVKKPSSIKKPSSVKKPSSTKNPYSNVNNWIPSGMKTPNQQFNPYSPPKELRADFDQFTDEFDDNNDNNNIMEFDENNIELLDIDEDEK